MINLPLCVRCDCSAVAPKATNRWLKAEEDDGCYGEDDGMAESEARKKKYKQKHHVSEEEQSHSCLREKLHPRALKHLLEV